MNRHERRAAKKARSCPGLVVNINFGRLLPPAPAEAIECGACGKQVVPYGIAEIQGNQCKCTPCAVLPLCETCFCTDPTSDVLIQKIWKAPDLEIQDGGEASMQHILEISAALSERHDATEH
jgi:hypothetical protein